MILTWLENKKFWILTKQFPGIINCYVLRFPPLLFNCIHVFGRDGVCVCVCVVCNSGKGYIIGKICATWFSNFLYLSHIVTLFWNRNFLHMLTYRELFPSLIIKFAPKYKLRDRNGKIISGDLCMWMVPQSLPIILPPLPTTHRHPHDWVSV